jgi:hypothetical protein
MTDKSKIAIKRPLLPFVRSMALIAGIVVGLACIERNCAAEAKQSFWIPTPDCLSGAASMTILVVALDAVWLTVRHLSGR